ncbi:MAG: leucine-rich repeat domain-containing protein, partial [Bacilli bacterium]|nr:leucine-rich repeat domain-containing protein [Bacilli bacterium]
SVGFAVVATNLIVNNNSSVAFSGDFEVIFSNAKTTGGRAYITDNGRTLNYKAAPLTEVGSQTSVTYDVTNNSANYDANLDISITDDNGNPISSDYFTIEETVKLPSTIEARSTVSGTLTITKTKSNNEDIHSFFKITINANPVERNTLGDGEYFAYTPSQSGLYDEKNNLLADWDTLVNEYGLNLSKSYPVEEILNSSIESAGDRALQEITGLSLEELHSKYGDSYEDDQIFIDYPELEKFKNDRFAILEYMDFEYPDKSMLGSIIKENKELQNAYRLVIDESVTELSPGSLTMIKNGVKEIYIPGTVTKINQAFMYNMSTEKVIFGDGIENIDPYSFVIALGLKSIVIPSSVKQISGNAFAYCTNLSNIENNSEEFKLINGVLYDKNISSIILYSAAKQDEVYDIPNGIKSIDEGALLNNYIKIINIPSSVDNISPYAFENVSKLESINVDANNSNYESVDGVLIDKTEKELLIYPINKKYIDYVIPDGITSIHYSCFDSDMPIENITIPASVTDIGNINQLTKLKSIIIDKDNKSFVLEDNVLLNANKTILYKYIGSDTISYTIPSTVERIESKSFYGSNLTRVVIPNSTNWISYDTFSNCKNLSSVHFENPNGWTAYNTTLNSDELSDETIAAKYLTKDHVDESWSRK